MGTIGLAGTGVLGVKARAVTPRPRLSPSACKWPGRGRSAILDRVGAIHPQIAPGKTSRKSMVACLCEQVSMDRIGYIAGLDGGFAPGHRD